MKHIKNLACLLLAMIIVLNLGTAAFAANSTGSITIHPNTNVPVAGKTFNAYKILDVTSYYDDSAVYTVPIVLKAFYQTRYDLTGNESDFDAQVAAKIAEETDLFAFAADALAAAKDAGITPGKETAGADAESVTISNLPLGYYVVEDVGGAKPISALMLDTTNPDIVLEIKADQPGIDKKIDGDNDSDDSTTGLVENNNAAVGSIVPYVVTSRVPDMTGYEKYYFVVNDTLSKGLTFNGDVTITIGSNILVQDTDYTVTKTDNDDGTTSVEIVFKNFIQYKDNKNDAITIEYSATVNEAAVIGVAGNPNTVTLTYSNNPNIQDAGTSGNPDKPSPSSPTGETPKEYTRTYVTAVELIKVDSHGNRLTGAEFTIEGTKLNTVLVRTDVYTEDTNGMYWKLKDGSYTTDDPNTDGIDPDKYESTVTRYIKAVQTSAIHKSENVSYTATVGTDGILRFEGLSAGQYTITEIKSPAGYNLLESPINISIDWTAPTAPSTDCTWGVTGNNSAIVDNGIVKITIENNAGAELPSTGGTGTAIFYAAGAILILAAVVLLVTRRRMRFKV